MTLLFSSAVVLDATRECEKGEGSERNESNLVKDKEEEEGTDSDERARSRTKSGELERMRGEERKGGHFYL